MIDVSTGFIHIIIAQALTKDTEKIIIVPPPPCDFYIYGYGCVEKKKRFLAE